MNSIWRSRRAWLRRARLTNISPMPLRSSGGLLGGHLAGHPLDLVEGAGQLADLVGAGDLDGVIEPELEAQLVLGRVLAATR